MFLELWQSTAQFYSRFFDTGLPTIRQAFQVVCEERAELDDQIIFGVNRNEMANEAVDNIVTLMGLQMACSGNKNYPYNGLQFEESDWGNSSDYQYKWLLRERMTVNEDLAAHFHSLLKNDIRNEIKAIVDILISYRVSVSEFNDAVLYVIDKNNNKNLETHYVNGNGKIARKRP